MAEKSKIMRQLGFLAFQLSRLRFDKIGSLFQEAETFQPKTCLSPALVFHERDQLGDVIPRGPFTDECKVYTALTSALRLHAEKLPLYHHAFLAPLPLPSEYEKYDDYLAAVSLWNDFVIMGSKIEGKQNRLDYIIVATLLHQMIPSLSLDDINLLGDTETGLPPSHPDLSPNNIFVDDDLNITCIID
jgi:hypothetical protein